MRHLKAFVKIVPYVPTYLIKLGGLVLGIDVVLIRGNTQPLLVLLAAFMMSGAQLSQGTVAAFFERVFGPPIHHQQPPPPPPPAELPPARDTPA